MSTISPLDKIDFIASIILDISPPEAILLSGLRFSPGFVEIKNSMSSHPLIVKSDSVIFTLKTTLFMSSSASSLIMDSAKNSPAFILVSVNFFAAAVKASLDFFTSSFIASIVFSKFSISAISSSHLLQYSKTESISKQLYLRFKSDINASLF